MVASGRVTAGPLGVTWRALDSALRLGFRGLQGGSSLARLLAEHRHVRNLCQLPRLSRQQIRVWARAHRRRSCGLGEGASPPHGGVAVPGIGAYRGCAG
jgi:hypothetical protein